MQKSKLDLFLMGYDLDFPMPTEAEIEAERAIIERHALAREQATPTYKRPRQIAPMAYPMQKQMIRVAVPTRRLINQGKGNTLDKIAQMINRVVSGHVYVWIEATNQARGIMQLREQIHSHGGTHETYAQRTLGRIIQFAITGEK